MGELMKLVDVIMSVAFSPRYNIAPTQQAPVIFMDKKGPEMKMMRWGLIPSWSKTEKLETELINAKAETLKEKPSYRQAYEKRRCLVPADSFYEWQTREGKRQPFRVMFKSGEPFCFAGLWERWIRPASNQELEQDLDEPLPSQTVESFTIITTKANESIAPLHNRMPVIVQPEHYLWWLENKPRSSLYETVLANPEQAPLKIYPVNTLVNSNKTDDPRCIEPVRIERDMFEKPWWGD